MNSANTNNAMLAAAARILELTKRAVLEHPDPAPERADQQIGRDSPAVRARRAGNRAGQERRREWIG